MKQIEKVVLPHGILQWLRNADQLIALFGEDALNAALYESPYKDYRSHQITTREYFEHAPKWKGLYERTDNPTPREKVVTITDAHGRNTRHTIRTYEYIVASSYQSEVEEYLFRACIIKLVPWFNDFDWAVYSIGYDRSGHQIYLKTGYADDCWGNELSLHVLVSDLLARDWKAIKDKHTAYWVWYTRADILPDDKWNANTEYTRKQYFDAQMEIFKTPAVKQFKKLLTDKSN